MASIPRITVYGRSPDAPPDDFQRVADDMGGFTRGDATQGFSRVQASTGAPEGSPALAPAVAQAEPAPATPDAGGFSRVPNQAVAGAFEQLPDQPADQSFTTPAGTFTPLSGGPTRTPWFDKMLEPITSYPATQRRMAGEGVEQMKSGVEQIGTKGERTKGFFNTALGALNYTFSPINAAAHTIVGKPLEENTGLPHQYSEFATTLALPIVGFGKVPKGVQKIFSPETVSQEAMDAAALIRQRSGLAARDTETTAAQLESYSKPVSELPTGVSPAGAPPVMAAPDTQLGIMHYIEGTGAAPSTPPMRALADTLKQSFAERLAKLQALPQHAQMDFVENYFPHFWKNPALAQSVVTSGGFLRQGSGASLKARTVPTIEDGIKQGLEPLTTNPIDATMHYITSIDKFIAAQEILNTAIKDGTVIYRRPTVMGASGHSNSLQGVPPGYAALKGRGSKDAMGATAYAPEDWARIYNNNISRGWADVGEEYGNAYTKAQTAANAITQTLLSFSGYHAFTMAEAGMSNQIAKSIEAINAGKPFNAAKEFAKTPLAPVAYAFKGAKLRDVYLGKLAARSPEEKEIVDLITQAGGRMAKQPKLADYDSSALGDYLTSFRRGKLAAEFKAQGADIAAAPIGGTFRTAASNIGRVMDTFNKPLFQHYIPMMKNAAASENLSQWIKLNPTASQAEKLAAARRVVDSVDNRFGEMIQDNIFWNKVAKQSAMLAMLSYSWNVGGWREIGGGVRDIARTSVGQGGWTPKASYVVATALNWAIMSASYQYMKTGEAPKDIHDLVAPRTGGVDARTGQDERIIPPGIMKDVFGYYEHPMQEVFNKVNPALKMVGQTLTNQDWRGDPIFSPKDPMQSAMEKVPDWLANYFSYVTKTMSPIQVQQLGRGPEEGSALNPVELGLGIRKAPRQFTDPEGYEIMLDKIKRDAWRRKMSHDKKEAERYKGGSE
jgi:hypothetical protein